MLNECRRVRHPVARIAPERRRAPRHIVLAAVLGACHVPIEQEPSLPHTELSRRVAAAASAHGPLVVAHRGDSGGFAENTLPAFAAALSAGAELVELDFHETADGVLVCIHDATLDRTTDSVSKLGVRDARVDRMQHAELAPLDAGSWKRPGDPKAEVPTLEAALRTIQPGSITMIEHKAGSAANLLDLLRRMDLIDAVLVQSFDWEWLAELRALAPTLTLGALGGHDSQPLLTADALARIEAIGVQFVHWDHRDLRAEDVRVLRERGWLSCVYTANTPDELRAMIELGVDMITTNHPSRLRELRRARSR